MKRVNIGIVGIGRLGQEHLRNLLNKIPAANVIAACSIVPEELQKAQQMGVPHVYSDYGQMLGHKSLDAVCLVTSTSMHASQIIQALDKGLHVFCEKPLAIKLADCPPILEKARRHKDKVVQIGFVRRFDASYLDAADRIKRGEIGRVYRVHSQTSDWTEFAEFQIAFSQSSGGIFHDYNIHDIDLVHWLSGARFKSVYALGNSFKYPAFADAGSADNTLCMAELDNGAVATVSANRVEPHGHGTHTIVYGTEGTLAIGVEPAANRIQIFDKHGVRQECTRTFYSRFEEAFVEELRSFIDCVAHGKPCSISLDDCMEATRVATAMTESFEKRIPVKL